MHSDSSLNHNDSANDNNSICNIIFNIHQNPSFKKILNTVMSENTILKRKNQTLTNLCQQHKSNYEAIKAEIGYYNNQTQQEYDKKITILQQQIKNQNYKLQAIQDKLRISQQQSSVNDIKYNKQIKTLQKKMKHYKAEMIAKINKLKKENDKKEEEIDTLKHTLSQKTTDIVTLLKEQKLLSAKLMQSVRCHLSPSTIKITAFKSYSSLPHQSELSVPSTVDILPNFTCYHHIHSDNDNYDASIGSTNGIKLRLSNMSQKILPSPIEVSTTETTECNNICITPFSLEKQASFDIADDDKMKVISGMVRKWENIFNIRVPHNISYIIFLFYYLGHIPQSQLLSPTLKNSETELSTDVDTSDHIITLND